MLVPPPRPLPVDGLGFVQTVDRLRQRVVIRVTTGANRNDSPGLVQSLGVADGKVVDATIAAVNQTSEILAAPCPDRHLERIQCQFSV